MEIDVAVEIPKGSRNKYERDAATGHLRLDRVLYSSVHYPTDYGFVPETLAGDGDELDAMVLIEEPTFPGCYIAARPIGVFLMTDEKGVDEKLLCVPVADPVWNPLTELNQVPAHLLREIEHFFQIYKSLEGKPTATFGWRDRAEAERVLEQSRRAFDARTP